MKPIPPPPEMPQGLSPQEQTDFLVTEGQAYNLKERVPAAYLYCAAPTAIRNGQSGPSCATYLDNFLEEAGAPTDPVERMLLEQIAIAHHGIGRLHTEAASATTPEAANIYNSAAAKLLGEFRRCVLALREYRLPVAVKNVTVVKQQNVAAGNQQIANFADDRSDGEDDQTKCGDNELSSNRRIEYVPATEFIPQSTSRCGRQAEPLKARTANGRRSRQAARNGINDETVA